MRSGDNPAVWKGLLERLLPARQKLTRGHHAALDYNDSPSTVKKLRASTGVAARAVEFIALTASRSGEARNATWEEVDFEQAIWTVPAVRMKAGRPHVVPPTNRSLVVLRELRQRSLSEFVFAGNTDSRPISDTAMTKALRIAAPKGVHTTLHGWRSTFRDWAGDCTNHPRDVAEVALAHSVGDATERAYRRKDALDKRRALMNDWETFLNG